MFTGIVVEIGRLSAAPVPSGAGGLRLRLAHSPALGERLRIGDSLAVAGVCLTVLSTDDGETALEVSPETLARTTLGGLTAGAAVNLEPALRVGEPLGGHWVQGHVDGVLRVSGRRDLGEHRVLELELPAAHRAQVVEKGSVTLDGVSLTVSALADDGVGGVARFSVALIPHTLERTTLSELQPGDSVNFEADILAKYIERALAARGVGTAWTAEKAGAAVPSAGAR